MTSVSPSVGELKTTSIGRQRNGRRRAGSSDATTCGALESDTPWPSDDEALLSHDRAGDFEPAIGVDPTIDVEVESLSARPDVGDPERAFSAAQDEVVVALAGRAWQVAKEIASAEVAGDGDRLTVEFPRFDRDRLDGRAARPAASPPSR